jgi:hypothetical protein
MTSRRHRPEREPNAAFDWREIICDSADVAKAEAERQQGLDNDAEAEWIYLKPEKSVTWVARRTPRHLGLPESSWDDLEAWWWSTLGWPSG